VFITEDNVTLYYKARRLLTPIIYELDIRFLSYLPKSPDLHPIEHLYKDEKMLSKDYRLSISSSVKAVRLEAKRRTYAI